MPNIKEGVIINQDCQPIGWSMAAILHECAVIAKYCRRAYAPMSNTPSRDNHEKINLWVSLSFLHMCMGSAWWFSGLLELCYKIPNELVMRTQEMIRN